MDVVVTEVVRELGAATGTFMRRAHAFLPSVWLTVSDELEISGSRRLAAGKLFSNENGWKPRINAPVLIYVRQGSGWTLGTDTQYGRDRKRPKKRRSLFNLLFDPLYPIFVVVIFGSLAAWYFKIPLRQYLSFDLTPFVRHILARWFY